MEIKLITPEQYATLIDIQKKHKILTFQNEGYQYINKSKFTDELVKAFNSITSILTDHITGFSEFNNFKLRKNGEIVIRFQYNWTADEAKDIYYIGVGYLGLDELLNGFKK